MAIDWLAYNKNRPAFPFEDLLQHAGRWVAWSRDGSRIIASAESEEKVRTHLCAQEVPTDDYVTEYVPRGDEPW